MEFFPIERFNRLNPPNLRSFLIYYQRLVSFEDFIVGLGLPEKHTNRNPMIFRSFLSHPKSLVSFEDFIGGFGLPEKHTNRNPTNLHYHYFRRYPQYLIPLKPLFFFLMLEN